MKRLLAAVFGLMALAGAARAEECPYKFNAIPLAEGQSLTCSCSAVGLPATVYGTDRYTADSFACPAALHAGVIGQAGGELTFHVGERCETYVGSERNGVSSRSYGAYGPSIAFTSPLPPCGDVARSEDLYERFASECQAQGGTSAYCSCYAENLSKAGEVIDVYLQLRDIITAGKNGTLVAGEILQLLGDAGLNVLMLKETSVGIMAEVSDRCDP